jgi:hypothetical protein
MPQRQKVGGGGDGKKTPRPRRPARDSVTANKTTNHQHNISRARSHYFDSGDSCTRRMSAFVRHIWSSSSRQPQVTHFSPGLPDAVLGFVGSHLMTLLSSSLSQSRSSPLALNFFRSSSLTCAFIFIQFSAFPPYMWLRQHDW